MHAASASRAASSSGTTSAPPPASLVNNHVDVETTPKVIAPVYAEDAIETASINPARLHVLSRPGRGRGVFASQDLPAGELIEDAPVLLLTKEQWEDGKMDDTILGEYGFCWSNGGMAIALGMGE